MGDNKKLLTVSIPTWNRAVLLNELLSELSNQVTDSFLEDEIEILISNNNSDDNTEEVVKSFRNRFSFIKYNRNDSNIGAKSNVLKSMELSVAEYVLFIGDDDRVRNGCLKDIIHALKANPDSGVIIDSAHFKKQYYPAGEISLDNLIEKYYWNIGNAGVFIIKSNFVKKYLNQFGYDFFNECWPQTQIIILGLSSNGKCLIQRLNIHSNSSHGEVMVYSSFYLWRTCCYELLNSIDDIKKYIAGDVYLAARIYLKTNLGQQLFNILQCGIFVDDPPIRKKTRRHIFKNRSQFSAYENIFLLIIYIALLLPTYFSRLLSNIFIFIIRGREGILKKNRFVQNEIEKRTVSDTSKSIIIRALEFEK